MAVEGVAGACVFMAAMDTGARTPRSDTRLLSDVLSRLFSCEYLGRGAAPASICVHHTAVHSVNAERRGCATHHALAPLRPVAQCGGYRTVAAGFGAMYSQVVCCSYPPSPGPPPTPSTGHTQRGGHEASAVRVVESSTAFTARCSVLKSEG